MLPSRSLALPLVAAVVAGALGAAADRVSGTSSCGGSSASASGSAADDRVVDLHDNLGNFAYLELEDDDTGPPPAVGHWNTFIPREDDLPADPDHLLVAGNDEVGGPVPTFAGEVLGELTRVGFVLSRGLAADGPPQVTLDVTLTVDGEVLLDGPIPVTVDESRLDVCHLAHLGAYYAEVHGIDAALASRSMPNGTDVLHRVELAFAPTGEGEGVPPIEFFGIDTQPTPSFLYFNTALRLGPVTFVE